MLDSRSETQTVDYEHSIQLNLVESLVKTARRAQEHRAARDILDQFVSFSEAHFMAEQLLMRLHAYPEYEEHTKQHDRLIEGCALLRQTLSDGDLNGFLDGTQRLKDNLLHHMEAADRTLGAFLRASSEHTVE
jgi:hemerythrin-like metal-binding protein